MTSLSAFEPHNGAQNNQPARPSAFATGWALNVMRWTTQTGKTVDVAMASDVAGNITVQLALGGLPHSPGAVLHQDAYALRFQVERPVGATGAPLRHLAAVGTEVSEGGTTGPPTMGRPTSMQLGRAHYWPSWPAELRRVHGGLTRRQASARHTPATRSREPRTSADPLTP